MAEHKRYKKIRKEVKKMAKKYGMPEENIEGFIKAVEVEFGYEFRYAKWSQILGFADHNWDGKWDILWTLKDKLDIMLRALKRGGMIAKYEAMFDPEDIEEVRAWLGDVKDIHTGQVTIPVEKVRSKPDCVRLEGRHIYMHQLWELRKRIKGLIKNGNKWFDGQSEEEYKAKEKELVLEAASIFIMGDRWGD
jgi:hypothetical protein